jgi:hypothetical protein
MKLAQEQIVMPDAQNNANSLPVKFSLGEQIECVGREIAIRKKVAWVNKGRMKLDAAEREIALMQAVHDTLTALSALRNSIGWRVGLFDDLDYIR